MQSRKRVLLSTTVAPMVVFAGVAATGAALTGAQPVARAVAQCAAAKCNPCAAAKPNPCNPCAAAKCNPCAAAKCNPCAAAKCNPCAAGACNPCNPCSAGGGSAVSQACFVPRLQSAAACNPCAVAKCNPCNPCAAAKCNPCNPCAAAKCNPCAAAKCNPCNPCAAGACNPCAAGGAVELTDAEAIAVYDCLLRELKAAYAKSDNEVALSYAAWPRFSKQPYQSSTHGNRYVQNYANDKARAYGAYEEAGKMPAGSALAKDSFAVQANGRVAVGPLFIMEKMNAGFYPASDDWRYTMVMPDGSIFGTTQGRGAKKVEFCIGCHIAVAPDIDSMMFMPEEYRVIR